MKCPSARSEKSNQVCSLSQICTRIVIASRAYVIEQSLLGIVNILYSVAIFVPRHFRLASCGYIQCSSVSIQTHPSFTDLHQIATRGNSIETSAIKRQVLMIRLLHSSVNGWQFQITNESNLMMRNSGCRSFKVRCEWWALHLFSI